MYTALHVEAVVPLADAPGTIKFNAGWHDDISFAATNHPPQIIAASA
jgi:hypothetical protein